MIRYGYAEPRQLQRLKPFHERAVGILAEASSAVCGARSDVTVDQYDFVLVDGGAHLRGSRTAVQREERSHSVHGIHKITEMPVECFPGQLGVHIGVVSREREPGYSRTPLGELAAQGVRERALTSPVQPFDDNQPTHGAHSKPSVPRHNLLARVSS